MSGAAGGGRVGRFRRGQGVGRAQEARRQVDLIEDGGDGGTVTISGGTILASGSNGGAV